MKILIAHNHYQQAGGEDQSFAAEVAVLREAGHEVVAYTVHNDSINEMGRAALAARTVWNDKAYDDLSKLIHRTKPDVVHFNNTFPLISPSAYYAAQAEGVPVVQSLRNYRLLCPNGLFHRDGRVCEDCLGKVIPWPSVIHRCYRSSRAATTVVGAMLTCHRFARTWTRAVDLYIALTDFSRAKFIEGGLPASKIVVKPNFLREDPGLGCGAGGYAIFVGRLSEEKGIRTTIEAWRRLGSDTPHLKIVGDGPLRNEIVAAAALMPEGTVEYLGQRPINEVYDLIGNASFLVFPSEWYETFGRVAIEAFAKGTAVIASRIGAIAELVNDGHTGLLFTAGDAGDLAAKVREHNGYSPERKHMMRRAARLEFESKYTARRNVDLLNNIYTSVLQESRARQRADSGGALAHRPLQSRS